MCSRWNAPARRQATKSPAYQVLWVNGSGLRLLQIGEPHSGGSHPFARSTGALSDYRSQPHSDLHRTAPHTFLALKPEPQPIRAVPATQDLVPFASVSPSQCGPPSLFERADFVFSPRRVLAGHGHVLSLPYFEPQLTIDKRERVSAALTIAIYTTNRADIQVRGLIDALKEQSKAGCEWQPRARRDDSHESGSHVGRNFQQDVRSVRREPVQEPRHR
jgi:hypothetical protein